jgi:hypothetical protein
MPRSGPVVFNLRRRPGGFQDLPNEVEIPDSLHCETSRPAELECGLALVVDSDGGGHVALRLFVVAGWLGVLGWGQVIAEDHLVIEQANGVIAGRTARAGRRVRACR